jgi:O-antigen ligase
MVTISRDLSTEATRHAVAASGGIVLASVVSRAWSLEPRYVAVFVGTAVLLAGTLGLIAHVRRLFLYVLAFNLAFTSIEKTFAVSQSSTFVTSGIAIGLGDLTLAVLYALWFIAVFVTRHQERPRLTRLDVCVSAFWLVHLLSVVNSISPVLTAYEVARLTKYCLLYFYIAHNLRRQDLKWIIAGVLLTIALQTSVAVVQHRTGKLMGVGRTKGASDAQYEQYTVTNFESVRRAEGTTFDSHALGLFMAMSLTIPAALALSAAIRPKWRLVAAAGVLAGLPALAISFSRAGWAAFAAATITLLVCQAVWGRWRSIGLVCALAATVGSAAVLPFASQIKQRLFEAPPELLSARRETVEMALEILKDSPWIGTGANSYMVALEQRFSIFEGDPYFIPVHNMFVFVLTELGFLGAGVFVALSCTAAAVNIRLVRTGDTLFGAFGAALLAALVALHVEGLTDPIYITNVTYTQFWFQLGLSAGSARLIRVI